MLIQIICSILILLFAYAGLSKLVDHAMFYVQLVRMPFLSSFAGFIAWALPLLEFAIVAALLFPATMRYGLYAAFVLLSMFVLFLLVMVMFTTSLPCSCGGIIAKLTWQQHIVFNVFFVALSIAGIWLHNKMIRP